jgi:Spy/CpxP family protein refolding chaperone
MKLKLATLTALGALALGSSAFAQSPQPSESGGRGQRGHRGGERHASLDRLTENLNLTPEQKAKVQPILDQARPQIETIRREAMQKTKTVMDNTMTQIRPLLTAEQQKQLDDAQNNRRGGRQGHGGRRGRGGQAGQTDSGDQ